MRRLEIDHLRLAIRAAEQGGAEEAGGAEAAIRANVEDRYRDVGQVVEERRVVVLAHHGLGVGDELVRLERRGAAQVVEEVGLAGEIEPGGKAVRTEGAARP